MKVFSFIEDKGGARLEGVAVKDFKDALLVTSLLTDLISSSYDKATTAKTRFRR